MLYRLSGDGDLQDPTIGYTIITNFMLMIMLSLGPKMNMKDRLKKTTKQKPKVHSAQDLCVNPKTMKTIGQRISL